MKRFLPLLLAICLILSMLPFSSAADYGSATVKVIDLGDGFSCEITTQVITHTRLRTVNQTTDARKTAIVRDNNNREVGRFVLCGTFSYNGTSARATSSDWDASAASGYSYDGNSYCSGASVRGSCTFSGNGTSKTVSLTITCDKNGNIS